MAGYQYEAVEIESGRAKSGVIEADSAKLARSKLRELGLIGLEISALSGDNTTNKFRFARSLPAVQLSLFTRQFAVLLEAGLTIEQSLNALIEQAEAPAMRQILAAIRGDILAGQPLARALENHKGAFPEIYRTLIAAGEQTGKLGQVLLRLADYLEARHALRQKIGLALIYPAIISLVAVIVVLALLTYVVPQVVNVFHDTKQVLPFLTRALLWTSDTLKTYGIYGAMILAGGGYALQKLLQIPAYRIRFDAWTLRLPLIGKLIRGMNTARFASTMAILVGSGVPLLHALSAGAGVVSNLPMRSAVEEAARKVREGGSLSRAIQQSKAFPPLFVHLIASGEASGKLEHMLDRAATQQTQELETRAAVITGLFEPLLILVMGVVVLLIVLAILLPIFEMNQLVH
jgi:general secretion pathway protein F